MEAGTAGCGASLLGRPAHDLPAAAATAAATTAATTAAAAAAATLALLRFVDAKRAVTVVTAIELGDRLDCTVSVHLDEAETARATCLAACRMSPRASSSL